MTEMPVCDDTGDDVDDCHGLDYDEDDEADAIAQQRLDER